MLKLSHLHDVNCATFGRDQLLEKLRLVKQGQFTVILGPKLVATEDAEVKRRLQPELERILNERIGQANKALTAFGIDVLG